MPPPPPLPPPPPPAPRPPPKDSSASQCQPTADASVPSSSSCFQRMKIQPSKVFEEIQKFAENERNRRSRSTDDNDPNYFLAILTDVQPILQNGPTCGLVALAMVDSLRRSGCDRDSEEGAKVDMEINPDVMLAEAIEAGYSRKGEMFSAREMLHLGEKFFPGSSFQMLDTEGKDADKEIMEHLLDGNSILIPYDADFNHGPALRNGHAAHWGLLHGIAILFPNPRSAINTLHEFIHEPKQKGLSDGSTTQNSIAFSDNNIDILEQLSISQNFKDALKELVCENKNQFCIYAIGHQGKSVHAGIWELDILLKSNQNLREISPKILDTQEKEPMILSNIVNSLCSQVILIKRNYNVLL